MMKRLTFFTVFILMACHAAFGQLPFPETVGEKTDGMQAIIEATRDAQQADTQIWSFVGCFGGVLGVAGAYALTPSVPPIKLLGKSPEYVAYYTQTYQQEVKNQRTKNAALGCIGGYAAIAIFYLMLLQHHYY